MFTHRRLAIVVVLAGFLPVVMVMRRCRHETIELPSRKHADLEAGDSAAASERLLRPRRHAPSFVPDPVASPAQTEHVDSALWIQIVDEKGAPVRGAAMRIGLSPNRRPPEERIAKTLAPLLEREYWPQPGESIVSLRLPKEADRARLIAFGSVPDLPPIAPVEFTVCSGELQTVRLIAANPRNADVIVVSAASDLPISGARVVSDTELRRRLLLRLDERGPATTGTDGRCRVEGLGSGEHDIEVNANGYRSAQAKWTGGEIRVRLEPQKGSCAVRVRVSGPSGEPVPKIRVSLAGTDRKLRTDDAGLAEFLDVEPGFVVLFLESSDWDSYVKDLARIPEEVRNEAVLDNARDGETYELSLGVATRGTGSLVGRLLDAEDAPIAGAQIKVFDVGNFEKIAATDLSGTVLFNGMPKGNYQVSVLLGPDARWYFRGPRLEDDGHAKASWKLGLLTIRGRIVRGIGGEGADGIAIWFHGSATGFTRSDVRGRFELPLASPGTYRIEAASMTAGAFQRSLTIPADGELVIELIEYGSVAARFYADDRDRLRTAEVWLIAEGDDSVLARFEPGTGDDDLVARNVLPGDYEIEVQIKSRKRRFHVTVTSGTTSIAEIRAP